MVGTLQPRELHGGYPSAQSAWWVPFSLESYMVGIPFSLESYMVGTLQPRELHGGYTLQPRELHGGYPSA